MNKIQIKRLLKNGNNPTVLANYWKVIVPRLGQSNYLAGKLNGGLHYNSALVPFLLSNRNRVAGFFDLNEVKIRRQQANNGKDLAGLAAELRYVPVLPLTSVAGGDGQICPTQGISVTPRTTSFAINRKTTMQPIELSLAQIRCLQEGSDQQVDYTLLNYFAAAASQFVIDVETEFFSKTNGQYRHVGNLPPKNSIGTRTAGENLALFKADGITPNPFGESQMYEDFAQAGVPASQMFFVGGTGFSNYAKLKQWSVPNDQGFNAALFNTIEVGDMRNWFSSLINSKTGLSNPVLAIRPGAAQIITANKNVGDFERISDTKKRTTVVDPFLGLTWDLYENVVECEEEIVTRIWVEINWALITYPDCDPDDQGPLRRGVNDVFLYNMVCQDTSACEIEPVAFDPPSFAGNVSSTCNNEELVCLPNACTVSLSASVSIGGDLIVNAGFNPSSSIDTPAYTWTLNGSPVSGSGNVLSLPVGSWDNGDVVGVTVEQGDDCTATAEIVINEACPSIRLEFVNLSSVGTDLAENGTLDIGEQERGLIGTLRIHNDSNNNANLVVTVISETNGVLALGAFTVPATIAEGDYIEVTLTIPAGAADGDYTAKFSVTSNDCDSPAFATNLKYEVVTA